MKISIGSTNPVKYNATRIAFEKVYPNVRFQFTCLEVDSGVPAQPFDEQTVLGAKNRALHALETVKADFGVGIEGGIDKTPYGAFEKAWCAVMDQEKHCSLSASATVPLPEKILKLIEENGLEYGVAVDKILEKENSKQKEGFVGFLTNNLIDQTTLYTDMIILAVSQFAQRILFTEHRAIYFAASISAGRDYIQNYVRIVEILKKMGHTVLSEHVADPMLTAIAGEVEISSQEIYQRDIAWINQCDVMVAEVTKPSLGVGFEIAYAVNRKKTVIALHYQNAEQRLSSMIVGQNSKYIRVLDYTLENLEVILRESIKIDHKI